MFNRKLSQLVGAGVLLASSSVSVFAPSGPQAAAPYKITAISRTVPTTLAVRSLDTACPGGLIFVGTSKKDSDDD